MKIVEKLSKNKKIAIFLAITLFFVILPTLFFSKQTELVFTAFVVIVALFAIFFAIKKQSFEAMLVFAFLAGIESLISNFAPQLTLPISENKTTFVFCISIILGAIIVFFNRKKIKLDKAKIILLAFVILSTASLFYTPDFNAGLFRALILVSIVSIIFSFSAIEIDEQKIKKICLAFLFGVLSLAIVTILKFFLWHWRFAEFTKTSSNEIAYFFGAALLICIIGLITKKNQLQKIALLLGSVFLGFETLLTNSRAVAIAVLLSAIAFFVSRKKTILILGLGLITLILFFGANFLSNNSLLHHVSFVSITQMTSGRDLALLVSIKSFLASPLIGNGIGSFKTISEEYLPGINKNKYSIVTFTHAHNEFSQAASEIGIIGLVLFALFYIELFKKSKENIKKSFFIFISIVLLAHGLRICFFGIILALLLAEWKKREKNEQ